MKHHLRTLILAIVFIFGICNICSFADTEYSLTVIQNGMRITTRKAPGANITLSSKSDKVIGWTVEEGGVTLTNNSFVMPSANVSIRANYAASSYTITYNLDGGIVSGNPTTYTAADTITLVYPEKSGYVFTGWTGTGLSTITETVTIPAGSTGNRVYTANYSQKVSTSTTYSITYDLDGGTVGELGVNPNPATYTYSPLTFSTMITLTNPTKDGYTFSGWTGTGLSSPTSTVTIVPSEDCGNRRYIANWSTSSGSGDVTI